MEQKQCNNLKEYVWYVAYGSNINKERFMKYICDCNDKTEPAREMQYSIPYNMYFAGASRRWEDKGVAFLDVTKPGRAFGKAYKVTKEQFEEIQIAEGSSYTKRISLGEMEGLPAYTFTTETPHEECNSPSQAYVTTILKGLWDTYPNYPAEEMEKYLNDRAAMKKPL